MHELSITRNVVAIVSEQAAGQRVTRVRLEIGSLSAIMPDAIRFCFELCAAGSPLDGALLEIDQIPGLGHCSECGLDVRLDVPTGRCPACHIGVLRVVAGQEMNIKEMEVEPCA